MTDTRQSGSWVWLYKDSGEDVPIEVDRDDLPELDDRMLLWADAHVDSLEELAGLWKHLGIESQVAQLTEWGDDQPFYLNDILQLKVPVARTEPELSIVDLYCLVGTNWVVTVHDDDLDLIAEFNQPFEGDSKLGGLNGPAFTTIVLDWQLSGYFRAIEETQTEIDRLDEELLGESPDETGLLRRLKESRGRVRQLRQTLAPQRDLLGLLSHPETDKLIAPEAARDFERLANQVQRALEALDTTREMIVGTFDIFMTRTAQSTNDIMKRLTIVSVLLLPAAVIAGIMGMNFKVWIFETTWMFWVVIGSMVLLALATLSVAKRKKWL